MSKPGPVWVKIECCAFDCKYLRGHGSICCHPDGGFAVSDWRTEQPPATCPLRGQEHPEIAELKAEVERLNKDLEVCKKLERSRWEQAAILHGGRHR